MASQDDEFKQRVARRNANLRKAIGTQSRIDSGVMYDPGNPGKMAIVMESIEYGTFSVSCHSTAARAIAALEKDEAEGENEGWTRPMLVDLDNGKVWRLVATYRAELI